MLPGHGVERDARAHFSADRQNAGAPRAKERCPISRTGEMRVYNGGVFPGKKEILAKTFAP